MTTASLAPPGREEVTANASTTVPTRLVSVLWGSLHAALEPVLSAIAKAWIDFLVT